MRLYCTLVALFCLSFAVPTHASWLSRMIGGNGVDTNAVVSPAIVSNAVRKARAKLSPAVPITTVTPATLAAPNAQPISYPVAPVFSPSVDRAIAFLASLPSSMPWADRAAVLVSTLPTSMPWNDRAVVLVSALPSSMPLADRADVLVAVLPVSMPWNDRAAALVAAMPIQQPTGQEAHPVMSDPFVTLDDTHIWSVGVLGQLQRKIIAARNRGDDATYQTLLKQYWDIFAASQVRRESLKRKPISGALRAMR